jgi:hypothetical protein
MQLSETLLRGFVCSALVLVTAVHGWLSWRENQIQSAPLTNSAAYHPSGRLDELRESFFTLRERRKRNASHGVAKRFSEVASSVSGLDAWVEGAASSLGQTLRRDPPEPFKPEAFFVGPTSGTSRLSLLEWGVRGGVAAYTFEVSSPHRDQSGKLFRNARDGDLVGDLRLQSATTSGRSGKNYKELVRETARGKKIYRTVNLPDFDILELTFVHKKNSSLRFTLQVPYSDSDRRKAELSGYSFAEEVSFDIPLGTIALRDDPANGFREVTVGEGVVFTFAGEEYTVRNLAHDHVEVCRANTDNAPEKWMLRGADAELP